MIKKPTISILLLSLIGVIVMTLLSFQSSREDSQAREGQPDSDEQKIENLLNAIPNMDIAKLEPIDVQPFTLPEAGVDVMRVKLEETYEVQGIGTETVVLTGWIAVKHDNPTAYIPSQALSWNNSVIPTQFVGMELSGESKIFGPVKVTIDDRKLSIGQVGGDIRCDMDFYSTKQMEGYAMPPMPFITEWKEKKLNTKSKP